jgi:hypothetical protein
MRDVVSKECVGMAQYNGSGFVGELTLPIDLFSPAHALFASLLVHFLPLGWILAAAGSVIAFRAKHRDEGLCLRYGCVFRWCFPK